MPVSKTATLTPDPVSPDAQTLVAPVCWVKTSTGALGAVGAVVVSWTVTDTSGVVSCTPSTDSTEETCEASRSEAETTAEIGPRSRWTRPPTASTRLAAGPAPAPLPYWTMYTAEWPAVASAVPVAESEARKCHAERRDHEQAIPPTTG